MNIRSARLFPLMLALVLALSACTSGGPSNTRTPAASSTTPASPTPSSSGAPQDAAPSSPSPTPQVLTWSEQTFQRDYTAEDGTLVMSVNDVFPDVENADQNPAWSEISSYYAAEGAAYMATAGELAGYAADDYAVTKATGGEFLPFGEESGYRFSLETEDLVSVVRSYYANSVTGAAHPANYQFSEQFDLATGERLTLSSFFTDPEAARTRILETLSGKDALSGYSADTLSSEFKDEYFYLTEDGFVFYFQPDTVAPYAAGLLEFSIPYSELEDLLSPTL